MICCLCGEPFEENDVLIKVTAYRVKFSKGVRVVVRTGLEDGTNERVAHLTCPVQFGAPAALVGAERGIA